VPALVTVGEVAHFFRVSERTVWKWLAKGLIPSLTTPGGQRRIPVSIFDRPATKRGNPNP
jgi:excisionase family DNA binding protein